MLGSGTTNDMKYLIWTCPIHSFWKSILGNQDTMKVFCRILGWSLHWLYLGRWPSHDWNGDEFAETSKFGKLASDMYHLADGYGGVLFGTNCDLDFYYKVLRLENHNNQTRPCIWCPGNLTTLNWKDFRDAAPWLLSVYNTASWQEAHPDR